MIDRVDVSARDVSRRTRHVADLIFPRPKGIATASNLIGPSSRIIEDYVNKVLCVVASAGTGGAGTLGEAYVLGATGSTALAANASSGNGISWLNGDVDLAGRYFVWCSRYDATGSANELACATYQPGGRVSARANVALNTGTASVTPLMVLDAAADKLYVFYSNAGSTTVLAWKRYSVPAMTLDASGTVTLTNAFAQTVWIGGVAVGAGKCVIVYRNNAQTGLVITTITGLNGATATKADEQTDTTATFAERANVGGVMLSADATTVLIIGARAMIKYLVSSPFTKTVVATPAYSVNGAAVTGATIALDLGWGPLFFPNDRLDGGYLYFATYTRSVMTPGELISFRVAKYDWAADRVIEWRQYFLGVYESERIWNDGSDIWSGTGVTGGLSSGVGKYTLYLSGHFRMDAASADTAFNEVIFTVPRF